MNKHKAETQLKRLLGVPVEVYQQGSDIAVVWEDAPLKYSHLAELAEMFGTEAIDIDSEAVVGNCDTCDHGMVFRSKLTVRGVDLDYND